MVTSKKNGVRWTIPIQAQISKGEISAAYELRESTGQLDIPEDYEFAKLDPDEKGFYRAAYDSSLLAKLFMALQKNCLSAIDQVGLMNDLFELARSGQISTDVFLESVQVCDRYIKLCHLDGDFPELRCHSQYAYYQTSCWKF